MSNKFTVKFIKDVTVNESYIYMYAECETSVKWPLSLRNHRSVVNDFILDDFGSFHIELTWIVTYFNAMLVDISTYNTYSSDGGSFTFCLRRSLLRAVDLCCLGASSVSALLFLEIYCHSHWRLAFHCLLTDTLRAEQNFQLFFNRDGLRLLYSIALWCHILNIWIDICPQ